MLRQAQHEARRETGRAIGGLPMPHYPFEMKPFSLLIKPAGADCNLRCPYCFYLERGSLYPGEKSHRMPDDLLERMISSYMATDQPQYVFSWQGGEPTLMGLDFFRRVVELQQRHGRSGAIVGNGLQTNGVLINDEFARRLSRYRFLVGLSLDGPQEVHDHYRVRKDGSGSHADVMRAMDCLRRNRVEFNVLTLVTSANVRKGREIYRYLTDKGILYHQYIPCVEFDNEGQPAPWTITGEQWGEFLCEIFDEWSAHGVGRVSVRLNDSILALMLDGVRNVCQMGENCCQYFVVEHNGDVYPCDFFVRDDLKLGNIATDSWEQLQSSQDYAAFGAMKPKWHDDCAGCDYLKYCAGDCLKHRARGAGQDGLSWLCAGWKMFYGHSLSALSGIAEYIRRQRQAELTGIAAGHTAKVGRNDPCPCGSGKKFKKCHGAVHVV